MTTDTGSQHLTVIHRRIRHWRPQGRRLVMTQLTLIRGRNMNGGLASGVYFIVTADAAIEDIRVIDRAQQPAGGSMADIAFFGSRQMVIRFAGGDDTVMTTAAGTQHLSVIHIAGRYRREGHRR